MQQHHLVHRGQLVIFSVQMEQHDRLTLKKGNKIQQSSVISFKLPWLDWHTIFWLKATFQCMSAHIKNVGRISIQLREVLPPEALSLSNNTPVSARLLLQMTEPPKEEIIYIQVVGRIYQYFFPLQNSTLFSGKQCQLLHHLRISFHMILLKGQNESNFFLQMTAQKKKKRLV